MIVCFSTSSPLASVALITSDGRVLSAYSMHAPMRASGACMELLQRCLDEAGSILSEATAFAADLGPGSFTGSKVAVTIAKTMAFAQSVPTIGSDSFDLISASQTVVLPSKKGEWFVRRPGEEPCRQEALPEEAYVGYGVGVATQVFPEASRFAAIVSALERVQPENLLPNYLIEPSISMPKAPLSPLGGPNG